MRLLDLEPEFMRLTENGFRRVETIAEAQGVIFSCPRCFVDKGNTLVGVHSVLCWSRRAGVPDNVTPGPGRWALDGTGLHDLTLNPDGDPRRSVQLTPPGCAAHFVVTGGEVSFV